MTDKSPFAMKSPMYLFVLMFAIPAFTQAQHIDSETGKTYYDKAKTKLKEVYSYQEVTIYNPMEPEGTKQINKKHGPYFMYYRSGQVKIAGEYNKGEKHGNWIYYDKNGNMTKVEKYKEDKLKETIEDPDPMNYPKAIPGYDPYKEEDKEK